MDQFSGALAFHVFSCGPDSATTVFEGLGVGEALGFSDGVSVSSESGVAGTAAGPVCATGCCSGDAIAMATAPPPTARATTAATTSGTRLRFCGLRRPRVAGVVVVFSVAHVVPV